MSERSLPWHYGAPYEPAIAATRAELTRASFAATFPEPDWDRYIFFARRCGRHLSASKGRARTP